MNTKKTTLTTEMRKLGGINRARLFKESGAMDSHIKKMVAAGKKRRELEKIALAEYLEKNAPQEGSL